MIPDRALAHTLAHPPVADSGQDEGQSEVDQHLQALEGPVAVGRLVGDYFVVDGHELGYALIERCSVDQMSSRLAVAATRLKHGRRIEDVGADALQMGAGERISGLVNDIGRVRPGVGEGRAGWNQVRPSTG